MLHRIASAIAAVVALLGTATAHADSDRVVVMTSYPEVMTTRYEQAFEQAHPDIDLQIVWKRAGDAFAALSAPDQGGIDVYWTPAVETFMALRERHALQPLTVDRAVLPGRIDRQGISDPQGFFEAFEVAGYGLAVNPDVIAARRLAMPVRWEDLTAATYAGLIVMPVPGRVGFAPALYDVILQGAGWDAGWRLLSRIAANARLDTGAGMIDAVASGDAAVAVAIDFPIRAAIANGRRMALVYPQPTAFLPAHVAVTARAPHAKAARAFVDFVLSPAGQRLLTHPDIQRYPVRPDAYGSGPPGALNPFALPPGATFAYDGDLGARRRELIIALFDAAIAGPHSRLQALWGNIRQAEDVLAQTPDARRQSLLDEAKALAGFVPVTSVEAADPAALDRFRQDPAARDPWRQQIDDAHERARVLLRQIIPER